MKATAGAMAEANYLAKKKGEDLFPWDCLDILLVTYGEYRMARMKPLTIAKKIRDLMTVINGDAEIDEYVIETVNGYVNGE